MNNCSHDGGNLKVDGVLDRQLKEEMTMHALMLRENGVCMFCGVTVAYIEACEDDQERRNDPSINYPYV